MEIVREMRGHMTFAVLALGVLLLLPGVPDGGSPGYMQLAAATEAVSGEATDTCVAPSKTSMVAGHPRPVGEFCLVVAALGSDKLTCTADDTMPPGVCKVHYCDPTGCHDTTTSLPSDILNIQKGVTEGAITPDTSFDTTGIQSTGFENNLDANGYTQTSGFPTAPQASEGVPGADQIGTLNSSPNSESLLFSQNAPAPTAEQFSQSSSFSGDSSIYQSVTASPETTSGVTPVNAESTTLAPNSVNVEAPTGESTFAAPKKYDRPAPDTGDAVVVLAIHHGYDEFLLG